MTDMNQQIHEREMEMYHNYAELQELGAQVEPEVVANYDFV